MSGFVRGSIISTKFFLKDNTVTLIYITLFSFGIAFGAIAPGIVGDKSVSIINVIKNFFDENASLSVIALFSRNLISSLMYLAAVYLGGLCAIGLPFIALIPLIKGIALGGIISYQYIFCGVHGFLYTLVIVLLPNALLMAVFNYAYTEGIYMSLNVSNGIFNGKPRQVKYALSFMTFTKRFLIFAFAIVCISFMESLLCFVFAKVI